MQIAILYEDKTIFVSLEPEEYEQLLANELGIKKQVIHKANKKIVEMLKKKTLTS